MKDYEKIERYVQDLLKLSGLDMDGEGESAAGTLLFHAYVAVAMYELMSADERALIKGMQRRMKYFFTSTFNLRERKRKTEKEILPPNPLLKEKENKEKEERTIEIAAGREISVPFSDLDVRRNEFRQAVWARRDKYEVQMLADFFNYWSDENPKTHRMRFEEERYWNIDRRLPRWKSNQFSAANVQAAIRLKRTQKKLAEEQSAAGQQQADAAIRERENAEREAKAEESRQTQMLTEDYIREHPDSLMAKIYNQKKK